VADPLGRFVRAQDDGGTYQRAVAELRDGAKRSHWMWFVFPQLAGLGRSETARHFALADAAEARAYLEHPLLGGRLRACTRAVLGWAREHSPRQIFGEVDAAKFASSMTVFEHVDAAPASLFAEALDRMYGGRRDPLTLALLGTGS
jgi:uncharacterized protein (DUF1810 family)